MLGISGGMVSVTGLSVPNYVQRGVLSDIGHGLVALLEGVGCRFIISC